MDPDALCIKSNIEDLTICLQLCKKLELKYPPELKLNFAHSADKKHFESTINALLMENPLRSLSTVNTPEPTYQQNEEVKDQIQADFQTEKVPLKQELFVPDTNDLELEIEEYKSLHSSKGTSSSSAQTNQDHEELDLAKKPCETNQLEQVQKIQSEVEDNDDPDLIELEKNAYELTLQEKKPAVTTNKNSIQTNGQKAIISPIQADPIKLKYVQIQINEPRIKGIVERNSCCLEFDPNNARDLRVKGLEKNVKAFEEAFYRFLDSISWVQIGRTLTLEEYYLMLKCKSLIKVMKDHYVRLIRFNYDANRVVELNKNETIGYLIGERKDSLEYVKKYISEFYPKKIVLYQVQKHPLCSPVCNEAIEEYLKLIHLTTISENFKKFNQGLESDLKIRENRDFFEYYLITSTGRNSSKEIQYVIGKKAQELFLLNFTVQAEKDKYDDNFWKMYDEFSRRLLTMGFVLKCKPRGTRQGLLFSLVGKSDDFNPRYCLGLFDAPLFTEKTSEASLILRTDPQFEIKDALLPQLRVLTVKMESKNLFAKFDITGNTKEVLGAMSEICSAYSRILKSRANLDTFSENELNICTRGRGQNTISLIYLNPPISNFSRDPKGQESCFKSQRLQQSNEKLSRENLENTNILNSQFTGPSMQISKGDWKFEEEGTKNSLSATLTTEFKNREFRRIELLSDSPKKLSASSNELFALKKLLKERFGFEDRPIIVYKFSSQYIWDKYCKMRNTWTTQFGNLNSVETLESELIAEVALEQEDIERYCKDYSEFSKAISLKDSISKQELTQPICIKNKYYHVLAMFLAFLPSTKRSGTSYLLTESYAVYPLYSIFLPVNLF